MKSLTAFNKGIKIMRLFLFIILLHAPFFSNGQNCYINGFSPSSLSFSSLSSSQTVRILTDDLADYQVTTMLPTWVSVNRVSWNEFEVSVPVNTGSERTGDIFFSCNTGSGLQLPLGTPMVSITQAAGALPPIITGTTPNSRCGTGTVILGATASGGIINWYSSPTGGSSLGTGTSFTTPSISSTTTYYVDATSKGLTTTSRTPVEATVDPTPVITNPSTKTVCSGESTDISLTASVASSFTWIVGTITGGITGAISGSEGSGSTIDQVLTNSGNTTAGTVEYVVTPTSDAGNCVGSSSTITVTVNPEGQVNQPGNQVVCSGSSITSVNFTTNNTGGTTTYSWTNNQTSIGLAPSGTGNISSFEAINNGTAPVVATITVTPTFNNGVSCDGLTKTFTITVDPASNGGAVTGESTVCAGTNSTLLTLLGHTGNVVRWESSTDGGITWNTISNTATTTTYMATNLTTTTQYQAVVKNGVCDAVNSGSATVTVHSIPVAPALSSATPANTSSICAGDNSGTVTGTNGSGGSTGAVDEYRVSIDGGSSYSAYTNGSPITSTGATGDILVQARRTGGFSCDDTDWGTICTWKLNTPPTAPMMITGTTSICRGSRTTLTAIGGTEGSGCEYQWGTGFTVGENIIPDAISESYRTLPLYSYKVYWVRRIGNTACTNITEGVIRLVIVNEAPTASISYAGTPFCVSVTDPQAVTQTGTTGGVYTAAPAGLTIDAATGAIVPNTSIPGTYTVSYTIAASGGCPAVTATTLATIITPPPPPTIGAITHPTCLLATGSVELSGLPSIGSWVINPGNISGTGTSTTISGLSAGTHNYTVTNASGCTSVASDNVVINAQPPVPSPADRAVLMELYNATDGANWTNSANWGSCEPLDTWYGITTNAAGNVTDIELANNNLDGTIPTSIGNLTDLTDLVLDRNQLNGAIPPSIGNLIKLRFLYLNSNSLNGPIPTSICSLADLIVLNLSSNAFNDIIPSSIGNLKNLEILMLVRSQLKGKIPSSIGDLKNLRSLWLSENQLEGIIPDEIEKLINLTSLYLYENLFDEEDCPLIKSLIARGGWHSFVHSPQSDGFDFNTDCCTPVTVTTEPAVTQTTCASSGSTSFSVAATGTAPVMYQWQYNNGGAWESVTDATPAGAIYTDGDKAVMSVSGITDAGTYEYRCYLTNCSGANTATSTASLVVNTIPFPPTIGSITHPTCLLATGSVELSELPATGTWTIKPGNISGTGTNTTIAGLSAGTYNYTVTNASGCTSVASDNVVINAQPPVPPPAGNITGTATVCQGLAGVTYIVDEIANADSYVWEYTGSGITFTGGNTTATNSVTIDFSETATSGDLTVKGHDATCGDGTVSPGYAITVNPVQCAADRAVLMELYNATDGANWTNSTNWGSCEPLDAWYGITTNADGCVTKINLYNNHLVGSIPASIVNLTALSHLILQGNQLSGAIPALIDNLTNLTYLDLRFNQLENAIPASIGNLVSLEHLYLSSNQLNGTIPASIGNLVNLKELYLNNNRQLSGSIPVEIGNLVKLRFLDLSFDQLSGAIPASIGDLTDLTALCLNNNQLSGSIPASIGNLVNLEVLRIYNNTQLSGSIPASIGNLVNLIQLLLFNNQLSGTIPAEIGNLVKLQSLGLYGNQLSGAIPASIGNLNDLGYFYLNDNQLSGAIPASIGNLTNLKNLVINNNLFGLENCLLIQSLKAREGWSLFQHSPQYDGVNFDTDCSPESSNELKSTDGISESAGIEEMVVKLFPNPTSGKLTVHLQKGDDAVVNIEVTDLEGSRIYHTQTKENSMIIDLSQQSSGIYFVKIAQGDQLVVNKIVKK